MKMGTTVVGLGRQALEGGRHHLKLGGADVRAMGEAEKDQHVAPAEVLVGDRLAVWSTRVNGPPISALPLVCTAGPCAAWLSSRTAAPPSAPIRKPATTTARRRLRIYSPKLHQRAVTRARCQEPAEGQIARQQVDGVEPKRPPQLLHVEGVVQKDRAHAFEHMRGRQRRAQSPAASPADTDTG